MEWWCEFGLSDLVISRVSAAITFPYEVGGTSTCT